VADYLKAHTGPHTRIAVVGSEPQIYFYAQRHSATGYLYTYGMMEPQPYALRMQEEMVAEINAAQQEYLVWSKLPTSWSPRPDSNPFIFEWFQRYIRDYYLLVGAVHTTGDEPAYYWDDQAPVHAGQATILVFKQKTAD
jgi:hypothetical protein